MTALPAGLAIRQGAQLRPSGTAAVQLLAPPQWYRYPGVGSPGVPRDFKVKNLQITNHSGSTGAYSLYHDDDGTTYDLTTTLGDAIPINDRETHIIVLNLGFGDANGTLGVKTSVGNALTFTAAVEN